MALGAALPLEPEAAAAAPAYLLRLAAAVLADGCGPYLAAVEALALAELDPDGLPLLGLEYVALGPTRLPDGVEAVDVRGHPALLRLLGAAHAGADEGTRLLPDGEAGEVVHDLKRLLSLDLGVPLVEVEGLR